MITFMEFLNKKDNAARRQFAPPASPSVQVQQVYKDMFTKPIIKPKSFPRFPSSKTIVRLNGGRSVADKPLPSKPSDFLARKGSSFRKNF